MDNKFESREISFFNLENDLFFKLIQYIYNHSVIMSIIQFKIKLINIIILLISLYLINTIEYIVKNFRKCY
jgi:hypothetical protein